MHLSRASNPRSLPLPAILAVLAMLAVPAVLVPVTASLVFAGGARRMELVSQLGKTTRVKLYSGESLTFRVREQQEGLSGLFEGGDYLYGVTFELREWPKVEQDTIATIKGANRRVVREQKPAEELWGVPPSSFTLSGGEAGRYKLTASRPGYAPVEILIHIATFNIVDIDGVLEERFYHARFDVELTDPDEAGRAIPLLVESLDSEGRIVDQRKDVVLAPVKSGAHEYRSSRRIAISSVALEPFMDRVKRRDQHPLPEHFFDQAPLRIVAEGMLRVSFRNLQAVYPVPLGY